MSGPDVHVMRFEQRLDAPPEAVFPFFADPRNLEAITPPLLRFRLLTPDPWRWAPARSCSTRCGSTASRCAGTRLIQEWEPPSRFVDVQVRGPYRLWHHTHAL